MLISATIKQDTIEVHVDFEAGDEAQAAASINAFLAHLAGTVPVAQAQAPAFEAKALIEATEEIHHLKDRIKELEHPSAEQKLASGTPRKPRAKKGAEPAIAALDPNDVDHAAELALIEAMDPSPIIGDTSEPAIVTWADGTKSAAEVTAVRDDGMTEVTYADLDGKGSGVAHVRSEQVTPATIEYATEDEQDTLKDLFKRAGMGPLRQHEYLTTTYPGLPVTLATLTRDHVKAIVPLLTGQVRAIEASAALGVKGDPEAPPIDWNDGPTEPAGDQGAQGDEPSDLSAIVTFEQAAEVRFKASELRIAPGDARALLKQHFDLASPQDLTVGQARRVIDVLFPEFAASQEGVPF